MTAKNFAMGLGIVLLAVGIWGSITGGHPHNLIIFGINFAHNGVHLLTGIIALLAASKGEKYAKLYCLVFGAIYGVVAVGGLVNVQPLLRLLNLNFADDLLHLAIAASSLWIGITAKETALQK